MKSDELLPLVDLDVTVPRRLTKREVLSFLSKIYDPCGLVSPVLTPPKIVVQDCWKEKLRWDEEVNQDFRQRVAEVLKGFSSGNLRSVNRWLGVAPSQKEDMRLSLHVFTDASCRAYLRVDDAEGKVTVNLVLSKCRLVPPSEDTKPRLELLGALLGARLLNFLRQEYHGILRIDDEFLWTNFSVALAWINHGPRVGVVFVANRVEGIAAVGGVWSRIPTNENPSVAQLSASKIWWNGPHWLKEPETEWPKHRKNETDVTLAMMDLADIQKPEYLEDIGDLQNEQVSLNREECSMDTRLA